jgi:Replication initiation factor
VIEPKTCSLIDVGIDWITCTQSDHKLGKTLAAVALRLLDQELQKGNSLSPWAISGYHGFSCGHVQTGERHDSLIVRLGGEVARDHWRECYVLSGNVSRIDAQATYRLGIKPAVQLRKLFQKIRRATRGNGGAPALSLFSSSDGSATLYLGKRASEMFGRIYDKGAESGLSYYDGALRFECEVKGDKSVALSNAIWASDHEEGACERFVLDYFAQRFGLPALLETRRRDIAADGNICFALDRSLLPWSASDEDRKLAWLRSAVRPTVQFFSERGKSAIVLDVLGLLDQELDQPLGPIQELDHLQ